MAGKRNDGQLMATPGFADGSTMECNLGSTQTDACGSRKVIRAHLAFGTFAKNRASKARDFGPERRPEIHTVTACLVKPVDLQNAAGEVLRLTRCAQTSFKSSSVGASIRNTVRL